MIQTDFFESLFQKRSEGGKLDAYELAALLSCEKLRWYNLTQDERNLLETQPDLNSFLQSRKNSGSIPPEQTARLIVTGLLKLCLNTAEQENGSEKWRLLSVEEKTFKMETLFKWLYGCQPHFLLNKIRIKLTTEV